MPIYTYKCQRCGIEFKKKQTFSAPLLRHCPECRTGALRRVLQLPSIIFKGSGWYSTDHRTETDRLNRKNDKVHNSGGEKSQS